MINTDPGRCMAMGMIYYYREYEGADAHIRCERGEDLLGMTGDRYIRT